MKIKIQFLALILLCSCFAFNTQAAEKNMDRQRMEVRSNQIQQRVNEIKAMDLSRLSREQRLGLRSELKTDKKELREMGPYIYISAGALIIIIIVLILVL